MLQFWPLENKGRGKRISPIGGVLGKWYFGSNLRLRSEADSLLLEAMKSNMRACKESYEMRGILVPVLAIALVAASPLLAAGSWKPLGSGVNGHVNALAVYNGQVIVAGSFSTAGGIPANCIAAWDGNKWSVLGSGIDITYGGPTKVSALTVYKGQLIAAGSFPRAEGKRACCIAAWDGKSWSPLGEGVSTSVWALAVYDSQLIATGPISRAGDVKVMGTAAWNGSTWTALGAGGGGGMALAVYNGELIVGGKGAWNGTSWRALRSGAGEVPNVVRALTVYNGQLIAGGSATGPTGGGPCIAAWNGNSWSPMEPKLGGMVTAFAVYNDKLIAGGRFYFNTDRLVSRGVIAWDGSSWSPIGSEDFKGGAITAVVVYKQHLIAGGGWNLTADGDSIMMAHIAVWED